jgi:hypothetical protein
MEATLEHGEVAKAPRRLLRRSQLDGRTSMAKAVDRLTAAIERDLGGRDRLSAIEISLVEAFVGMAISLEDTNARLARGEPVDPAAHAQSTSTLMRLATRLGLQRRARDIVAAAEGDMS